MHGHSFGRKVELVIGTLSVRLRSNFPEIPEFSMHGHSFGRKVELVIGTSSVRLRSNFPEIPESVSDLIRKVIDSTPGEDRSNFVST